MKKNLLIPIECGEKTCGTAPGKWCRYSGVKRFGSIQVCLLFNEELHYEDGWVQRCKECLEREK